MKTLFSIELDSKISSLVEDIESRFGKKVKEQYLDNNSIQDGNSKVDNDGSPIVMIHPTKGVKIDIVVHELYHFILRDEGFPVIKWLFPKEMETTENINAFHQLNMQLNDPILHYKFHESIELLGIDPVESLNNNIKDYLEKGVFSKEYERMDKVAIALHYYALILNRVDKKLFDRCIELMINKAKHEGLVLGKKLVQIVLDKTDLTPKVGIEALVQCLNLIYNPKIKFIERDWTYRNLGKHRQEIAQIEIIMTN